MKRINDLRKIIVFVLSFLALTCFMFSFSTITTKADATPATATIYMQKGARVRTAGIIDGRNGISWQLAMDATTYGEIESTDVSYGILIAPEDYGALTEATVFAEDGKFWWKKFSDNTEVNKADGKKQIWNLETETLAVDGSIAYFNGSLVDVLPENVYREFNAVGYMKYLDGTQTKYKFADANDNVRTMTFVALRYLESAQNTLDATQEQAFRAKYVVTKPVGVTFNVNGNTQDETLDLAISEVYSANKLAKLAGVTITNLIKSADSVDNLKIAKDTTQISGEVKFESVESQNLAGTYALADGTLKLEFDGTASVTKGETTTYGNWKMAFDKNLYSTVAMVATSSADASMIVGIEKTESAYALVNGDENYDQTESGVTTIYEEMLGTYKQCIKYSIGSMYSTTVEIFKEGETYKIKCNYVTGTLTVNPESGVFGTYKSSSLGDAQGYYTKIDGKYHLFNQVTNNGLRHYGLLIQGKTEAISQDSLEDEVYKKLAGNYAYSIDGLTASATITDELFTFDSIAESTKSMRYGNVRKVSNVMVGSTSLGTSLDLILRSKDVGDLRFTQNDNNAYSSGNCPFFIAGDVAVFAINVNSGRILVKGESTTQQSYESAVRTFISGKYLGLDGFNLELNADGTAILKGEEISYQVFPERYITDTNVGNQAKSIYKGHIVIAFADGSAETINYDFTYGRTILTATGVDAMQIK